VLLLTALFRQLPAPRCYALRFEGQPGRDLFFWMQEPNAAQDGQHTAAVNAALGQSGELEALQSTLAAASPAPGAAAGSVTPLGGGVTATPAAEAAPPGTAPAAPHKPPSSGAVDLRSILASTLAGMGLPPPPGAVTPAPPARPGGITAAAAAAALAQAMQGLVGGAGEEAGADASLAELLTPEVLRPLLASPGVRERLAPHLPPSQLSHASLVDLVASPQFTSQLASFSRALRSGAINLQQFGLPPAQAVSVPQFLEAIAAAVPRPEEAAQPEEDEMKE